MNGSIEDFPDYGKQSEIHRALGKEIDKAIREVLLKRVSREMASIEKLRNTYDMIAGFMKASLSYLEVKGVLDLKNPQLFVLENLLDEEGKE